MYVEIKQSKISKAKLIAFVAGADRHCVIMGWQAQAAGPMLTPEHMAELEGMGRMTDTLRRLVGAPEA